MDEDWGCGSVFADIENIEAEPCHEQALPWDYANWDTMANNTPRHEEIVPILTESPRDVPLVDLTSSISLPSKASLPDVPSASDLRAQIRSQLSVKLRVAAQQRRPTDAPPPPSDSPEAAIRNPESSRPIPPSRRIKPLLVGPPPFTRHGRTR
jgi:hypothetical protein